MTQDVESSYLFPFVLADGAAELTPRLVAGELAGRAAVHRWHTESELTARVVFKPGLEDFDE